MPTITAMEIRAAIESDLPGIFDIYDRQVLRGTSTFETEPKTIQERMAWFAAHPEQRYPLIVAVEDGRVVGWAGVSQWSPRPGYRRSAENSVYTHPDYFGRGIGRALMDELIKRCEQVGIWVLIARITDDNQASIRLHEALGFQTVGTLRRIGEKFGRLLDVKVMDLHLDLREETR